MGPPQCMVCTNSASKYKCPSCLIPYCSLGCFKKHKEQPCEKKPKSSDGDTAPVTKTPALAAATTSGSVQDRPVIIDGLTEVLEQEKLESIASCAEIREALKNEDIRNLICAVDSSQNPSEELDKAMQLDMFRAFADKVITAANR